MRWSRSKGSRPRSRLVKKLTDLIRTLDEDKLDEEVAMPFPGKYTLADVLAYQYWNASYHEGQITFISSMLAKAPTP